VREHATSVHLMLDPDDAGQLDVDARQHPELGDTFYLTVDSERCHIALSGQAESLLAVVERLRAELAATTSPAQRGPSPPPRPASRNLTAAGTQHPAAAARSGWGSGGGHPLPRRTGHRARQGSGGGDGA
jgi:hypothetical protein